MVAAGEFEYSVQGLKHRHQDRGDDEAMGCAISIIGEIPTEEKREETHQGHPLEELDLRSKGEEGEGDT
jgi:hypothetical protein